MLGNEGLKNNIQNIEKINKRIVQLKSGIHFNDIYICVSVYVCVCVYVCVYVCVCICVCMCAHVPCTVHTQKECMEFLPAHPKIARNALEMHK